MISIFAILPALGGLLPSQIDVLAELWETVEPNISSILSKYQVALAACGNVQFDKGQELWQGTAALVKVRDALLHYRPEWDDELHVHEGLRKRLDKRFPLNALAAPGSLWFPHLCMGAGCAHWAVKQATEFSLEFCKRMGIPERMPSGMIAP